MGAGGIDALLAPVSYHAVTRYVQRVLGQAPIVSDPIISAQLCAELHCNAAGTTIAAVRKAILTAPVAAGLIAGAKQVRTAAFTAELSGGRHGVVSTVVLKPRRRASKILERREGRRAANRMQRKAKGRPSKSIRGREVEPV